MSYFRYISLIDKKIEAPNGNTTRSLYRPVKLDIGESLSAYLQAEINILHHRKEVNTFTKKKHFFIKNDKILLSTPDK